MAFYKLGCIGRYDFDKITEFAHKRFVEGMPLSALLRGARSTREKEEVAIISNMEVTPMTIRNIQLTCKHANHCSTKGCKSILHRLLDVHLY